MIETTDLTDHDRLDRETDRRTVLRSLGLLGGGAVAGLLARPAADAAATATRPDEPIRSVSLDDGSLTVDLADGHALDLLRIVRSGTEVVAEDLYLDDPTSYFVSSDSGETYRVTAYRGDYADPDEVQSVEVKA